MAGGGTIHAVDGELLDQLGPGEDFLGAVEAPAQPGQVVHHGLGQVALFHVLVEEDEDSALGVFVGLPLGELDLGADLGHERDVGEGGEVDPEGLEDQQLREGVGQVLVGPDDVGDLHLGVVDDAGEVVQGHPVGPDDHEVADVVGLHLDHALDEVAHQERPAHRDAEPEAEGPPLGLEPGAVGVGDGFFAEPIGDLVRLLGLAVGIALGLGRVVRGRRAPRLPGRRRPWRRIRTAPTGNRAREVRRPRALRPSPSPSTGSRPGCGTGRPRRGAAGRCRRSGGRTGPRHAGPTAS